MWADDGSLVRRDSLSLPGVYVGPRTPTEMRLAQIWAGVLTMDRVGVEDRYSDLGGDSFLATVIFEMIEETFQISLPAALFAAVATIAALATEIDSRLQSSRTAIRTTDPP